LRKRVFLTLLFFPSLGLAQVYLTQDEALRVAFPDAATIERKTIFLTPKQIDAIQNQAKAKCDREIINYYTGTDRNEILGYAFFSTRLIRTMPATIMVVIKPDGHIKMVEILSFFEPEDYYPSIRWLDLFKDKNLDDNLWVKRGIRNITGATLTTHSITDATRLYLAITAVVLGKGG